MRGFILGLVFCNVVLFLQGLAIRRRLRGPRDRPDFRMVQMVQRARRSWLPSFRKLANRL